MSLRSYHLILPTLLFYYDHYFMHTGNGRGSLQPQDPAMAAHLSPRHVLLSLITMGNFL